MGGVGTGGEAHLGRAAVLLRRRRQRERLVVGGRRLHVVVIVVSEAAEEGAEDAAAAVLLEAAVGLGDWREDHKMIRETSVRFSFCGERVQMSFQIASADAAF